LYHSLRATENSDRVEHCSSSIFQYVVCRVETRERRCSWDLTPIRTTTFNQTPSTPPSRPCFALHPSQAVVSTLNPLSHLHVSAPSQITCQDHRCTSRADSLSQQPHHRLTNNIRLPSLLRNFDIALVLYQLLQRAVGQAHWRFPWLPAWEHVDLGFESAKCVDGCCWCHSGVRR
jgi:hypothetical protein